MFINNDIIKSKKIVINLIKKQAFITSTDATISIKVKSSKNNIQRFVHIRKIIIISFHTEVAVFINDINLSKIRDFLFESTDDVNFILYVHLVNAFISVVIIRNDHAQSIQISRNFKFDRISKLNYFNAFQISSEQTEKIKSLAIKESKFTHKNDWFKKLLTVCVTAYAIATTVSVDAVNDNSNIELSIVTSSISAVVNIIISIIFIDQSSSSISILNLFDVSDLKSVFEKKSVFTKLVLFNNVIIHRSNAIDFFVKIVEEFSIIWHDIDFADLSKKN